MVKSLTHYHTPETNPVSEAPRRPRARRNRPQGLGSSPRLDGPGHLLLAAKHRHMGHADRWYQRKKDRKGDTNAYGSS